jgi:hypothetical protein
MVLRDTDLIFKLFKGIINYKMALYRLYTVSRSEGELIIEQPIGVYSSIELAIKDKAIAGVQY